MDVCNGAFQDKCNRCGISFQEPCADGIGDSPQMVTPYQTVNPTDRYPLMKPYHADTTPPSWPTNPFSAPAINSAFVGPTWVLLYWTQAIDDVKVTAYRLYANNALIATVPAGQPYYNATSLTPGTSYNFHVAAVDEDGNVGSPLSISITTPAVQPSASSIPSWYLLPVGFGAAAAVVATALFSRRHYRKKEGRREPSLSHLPQPQNTRPDTP